MAKHRLKRAGPTLRQGAPSRSPAGAGLITESSGVRWLALVLIAAGVLVYWNSLSGAFLFDDENSILNNPQIRTVWPLSVPLSPPRDTPVAGRPIVNLSFAVNYALGGLDVRGYHIFNVAIHVLAALTLFGIVRRTFTQPRLADRVGAASTTLAFVCALIWMLHPLQTEAVNYLSERTESMMGLFYLLTLYCCIRAGGRATGEGGRRKKWQVAAVSACAVGMACKESMVTAPVMVVLYDRIFVFDSFRTAFRVRRGLYGGLAATWLVLAWLMSSTPRTSVGFGSDTTPWVYLLNQFELIVQYLRLTVWPRALVLDYGLPRALTLRDVLPNALFVMALGVAVLAALARRPRLGFPGAWFFITLAPTTSIVPIATEVGAERRMYLPLAGLVVLAVVAFSLRSRNRVAGSVAAVLVCSLLATGTFLRNREYESRLSIAQTIVDRRPSGRAHFLLGSELVGAGRHDEAMAELRASARDYPGAHFALGTELLAAGMVDAAIAELQAFLRLLPSHANAIPARDMLGRAYLAQGRLDEAVREFEVVLTRPGYPFRDEVRGYVEQIRAVRPGAAQP